VTDVTENILEFICFVQKIKFKFIFKPTFV